MENKTHLNILWRLRQYWLNLGQLLHYCSSTIVLFLVFFLVLTPIAWIRKLAGKDPLQLKKQHRSTWRHSEQQADMQRQF